MAGWPPSYQTAFSAMTGPVAQLLGQASATSQGISAGLQQPQPQSQSMAGLATGGAAPLGGGLSGGSTLSPIMQMSQELNQITRNATQSAQGLIQQLNLGGSSSALTGVTNQFPTVSNLMDPNYIKRLQGNNTGLLSGLGGASGLGGSGVGGSAGLGVGGLGTQFDTAALGLGGSSAGSTAGTPDIASLLAGISGGTGGVGSSAVPIPTAAPAGGVTPQSSGPNRLLNVLGNINLDNVANLLGVPLQGSASGTASPVSSTGTGKSPEGLSSLASGLQSASSPNAGTGNATGGASTPTSSNGSKTPPANGILGEWLNQLQQSDAANPTAGLPADLQKLLAPGASLGANVPDSQEGVVSQILAKVEHLPEAVQDQITGLLEQLTPEQLQTLLMLLNLIVPEGGNGTGGAGSSDTDNGAFDESASNETFLDETLSGTGRTPGFVPLPVVDTGLTDILDPAAGQDDPLGVGGLPEDVGERRFLDQIFKWGELIPSLSVLDEVTTDGDTVDTSDTTGDTADDTVPTTDPAETDTTTGEYTPEEIDHFKKFFQWLQEEAKPSVEKVIEKVIEEDRLGGASSTSGNDTDEPDESDDTHDEENKPDPPETPVQSAVSKAIKAVKTRASGGDVDISQTVQDVQKAVEDVTDTLVTPAAAGDTKPVVHRSSEPTPQPQTAPPAPATDSLKAKPAKEHEGVGGKIAKTVAKKVSDKSGSTGKASKPDKVASKPDKVASKPPKPAKPSSTKKSA